MSQISKTSPDCYRERIEDVTTQLDSIKALFMNEILEIKHKVAETKAPNF